MTPAEKLARGIEAFTNTNPCVSGKAKEPDRIAPPACPQPCPCQCNQQLVDIIGNLVAVLRERSHG